MELWVRSQDKDILIKVDNLELDDERNDIYTHNCINNMQMTYTLGRYKTKERALEVLDEIHQRLINLQCLEVLGGGCVTNQMKKNGMDCVYEMPQE